MKLIKYFFTVCVGSLIDLTIFTLLTLINVPPEISHITSYTSGMLCNFYLQKKYVFKLKRKLSTALILSTTLWVIGLILSTYTMNILTNKYINIELIFIKIFVMGLTFTYNYCCRKFAFKD